LKDFIFKGIGSVYVKERQLFRTYQDEIGEIDHHANADPEFCILENVDPFIQNHPVECRDAEENQQKCIHNPGEVVDLSIAPDIKRAQVQQYR